MNFAYQVFSELNNSTDEFNSIKCKIMGSEEYSKIFEKLDTGFDESEVREIYKNKCFGFLGYYFSINQSLISSANWSLVFDSSIVTGNLKLTCSVVEKYGDLRAAAIKKRLESFRFDSNDINGKISRCKAFGISKTAELICRLLNENAITEELVISYLRGIKDRLCVVFILSEIIKVGCRVFILVSEFVDLIANKGDYLSVYVLLTYFSKLSQGPSINVDIQFYKSMKFYRSLFFGFRYSGFWIDDKDNLSLRYANTVHEFDFFTSKLNKNSKKKMALCVSGQFRVGSGPMLRTIDLLSSVYELDVFVSTWSNTFELNSIQLESYQIKFNFFRRYLPKKIVDKFGSDELIVNEFFSQYPNLVDSIVGYVNSDVSHIIADLNPECACIRDESEFEMSNSSRKGLLYKSSLNQAKMWSSIGIATKLALDHSLNKKCKYDVVLRIRPDVEILYFDEIDFNVPNNSISTSYILNQGVGDQVLASSMEVALIYSQIWNGMDRVGSTSFFDQSNGRFAEWLLADMLRESSIDIRIFKNTLISKIQTFEIPKILIVEAFNQDLQLRKDSALSHSLLDSALSEWITS